MQEEPGVAAQTSNEVGVFASVLGLVGSLAGSASHPRVFLGEQKQFSLSKRNRLKHTVFFLSFPGNRWIAISPLASAGRVASAYCRELKLSKIYKLSKDIYRGGELYEHIRSASDNVEFLSN